MAGASPLSGSLIKIEKMTDETVKDAARLERACFSCPWSLDSLISELSNPLAVFITASIDGETAGYAGMHHVVDEGYITNVAVFSEFRRRGIAKALVAELLRYGAENGLRMLTLEVRESNAAARALYSKLGFLAAGLRRNYYVLPTENAVIMTKEL